jgi:hypothetical protein
MQIPRFALNRVIGPMRFRMLNVMLKTDSEYVQVRARPSVYSASKRNRHALPEKYISNHLRSRPEIAY